MRLKELNVAPGEYKLGIRRGRVMLPPTPSLTLSKSRNARIKWRVVFYKWCLK